MNKILSVLGLVRRASKLSIGFNETVSAAKNKKARLTVYSNDVSPKTAKEVRFVSEKYGVPCIALDCTMEQLSVSIGVKAGVVAVNDRGFAEKLISLHNTIRKDESAI